jgi:S1-C subfamily serine protease
MIGSLENKGLPQAEQDFHSKYEAKQSLSTGKSFEKVLAGRVNHVGFVKGWDSSSYISFLSRLNRQGIFPRKHPATITQAASRSALYQSVWVIESGVSQQYAIQQSTGFSWGSNGIVTAAHAVGEYDNSGKWTPFNYLQVRQPHLGSGAVYKPALLKVDSHADLAILSYPFTPMTAFQLGSGRLLALRESVRILGFPHYHHGDSCTDQDFKINASRVYSGVHHHIVVGAIITGNSGGPVLNQKNEVVGVALKGQQIPAHFGDKDALSSFVVAETLEPLIAARQAKAIAAV